MTLALTQKKMHCLLNLTMNRTTVPVSHYLATVLFSDNDFGNNPIFKHKLLCWQESIFSAFQELVTDIGLGPSTNVWSTNIYWRELDLVQTSLPLTGQSHECKLIFISYPFLLLLRTLTPMVCPRTDMKAIEDCGVNRCLWTWPPWLQPTGESNL